ncbi:MAG: flavin reductase [Lachnospiraceae bacterium]|nr:flavin reductase [Lachnospiraceae bacterium]
MDQWKKIQPEELEKNAFQMIGKDWMLITAAKPDGTVNTMTASWGGMGVIWGQPVVYLVIRPQRYTLEFVDAAERLSITFFEETYRKALAHLGSVSGRDEDKIQTVGLTVERDGDVPYFREARVVLKCRKLYRQPMGAEFFVDPALAEENYLDKDYHILFVAGIEEAMVKEA